MDVLGIMEQKIFSHFQKMIETTMVVGDLFSGPIASAAESISSTLLAGGTIFSWGQGWNLSCRTFNQLSNIGI